MSIKALEQSGEVAALRSPGSVLLIGHRHAFESVAPRLLITDEHAMRGALYPYVGDDANRQRLLTMYQRIMCSTDTSWQQTPEQTIEQITGMARFGAIAALSLPESSDNGMEPGPVSEAELQQPPGPVTQWPLAARFAYVLRHLPDHLPDSARAELQKLFDSIHIVVGALVIWAGSHAVGVGQVVDVILIAVGFALIGWAIFDAIGHIIDFLTLTVNARSTADLDQAARALAQGVTIMGIGALIALLTRGAGRLARQSGGRRQARTAEAEPGNNGSSSSANAPPPRSQRLTTSDFPEIAQNVSGKQNRHIAGDPAYRGGGVLRSKADAQRVLDEWHSGSVDILGKNGRGFPVVRSPTVTGTNINVGAGFPNQPTNVFIIKGTTSPSVVPANPNWTP